LRFLKTILSVAIVVALLMIPGNGVDDHNDGQGRSNVSEDYPARPDRQDRVVAPSGRPDTSFVKRWPVWPESATVKYGMMVELSCPILVFSTSEAVWSTLTTARRFFLWYPHWKREMNVLRRLTAVGDTIGYYSGGELMGRSVVTGIEPFERLMITHELYAGGTAGSIQVSMQRTEHGIGLDYVETYPVLIESIDAQITGVCKRATLIKRLAEGE
jgi:hypothetical protein